MKNYLPYYPTQPRRPFLIMLALACFVQTTILLRPHQSTNYSISQNSLLDNSDLDTEIEEAPPAQNPDDSQDPLPPLAPDLPTDSFNFTSDLIFQAINPGYTIDGTRDVGELILLRNLTHSSLSLAGYSVRYVNSSGTSTTLLNFSEGTSMTGETLLMRLAKSPDNNLSDATYMTTLAMTAGSLELILDDTVVDSVCWGAKSSCYASFKSITPTTLVRNLETGEFSHGVDYIPPFDPDLPSLVLPQPTEPDNPDSPSDEALPSTSCRGLEFSEVFSYYADSADEQFIELYNPTDLTIFLSSCTLRYKNKTYPLTGQIAPDSYYAYFPSKNEPQFALTKNPTSSNSIELLDFDGAPIDILTYSHGQKKSMSYARFYDTSGDELWQQTYNPTPNLANLYQEFRTCPAGKVINPATGNCIKASTLESTITDCPEGKYRNPLTGRCKNIESASSELQPCAEGYERNPETNRCRKITSTNDGAGYALVPNTYSSETQFIATGIIVLLASSGSIYIILQFRREIARTARKVRQRLHGITKDLLSRRIRLHRHKKP